MSIVSLGLQHLALHSAEDVHELFRVLGYDVYDPQPFEGADLDELELDEVDAASVNRAYLVSNLDNHTVYLYEVSDLRQTRLRGLAWNALQRGGTALLIVTRDYREVVFAHPRFVGNATKSNVRVDKLKLITSDPTRHDLDTLNAIHAHRRTGQQVYEAQGEAFDAIKITNRFYKEYKDHYDRAREAIRRYNRGVPEFQNADQEDKLHAFTQRLLGRLMFLYFLQRKGWLGGHHRFLTDQFIDTVRRHAGEFGGDQETFYYYGEVLEPLFFETMNTRRPDNVTRWPGVRIPYLNGGLFDRGRDPEGMIILPDSLFDPHSSGGLLAFFNRYNFTVADDTPLEQDVAVDPEMLGKVFENMLEERDRGQTGSFYTPRTIVSYMCQEVLAGYLEESASIPRDTTRTQFDPDSSLGFTPDEAQRVMAALDTLTALDPAVGSGSFLIGMLQEIILLRRACASAQGIEVNPATVADWKEAIIRDTLYGVDIKPEAIEIAQLRLWLALVVDQTIDRARPLPNLDYKLMAGNSLIETIDGEPVLTESATALLTASFNGDWEAAESQLKMFEPNAMQMRMDLFESEKQTQHERVKLDALRAEFFRASPEERRQLRAEITAQERRIVFSSLKEKAEKAQETIDHLGRKAGQQNGHLERSDRRKLESATTKLARLTALQEDLRNPEAPLPFFLYRLHFSEVFAAKGGFDIVVANPPYVRMEAIKDQKPEFEAAYPDVYIGTADLYVYFFARGIQLLKPHGQLSYIAPNKWLRAGYGEKLRGFFANSVEIEQIIDFGHASVFKGADTFPCIVKFQKADGKPPLEMTTNVTQFPREEYKHWELRDFVEHQSYGVSTKRFSSTPWSLEMPEVERLMAKIQEAGVPLREYIGAEPYYGIKTGFNEAFLIDTATRNSLVEEDSACENIIKPYLRGQDIKRWTPEWAGLWMILLKSSENFHWPWSEAGKEAEQVFASTCPSLYQRLKPLEKKLRNRSDQGRYWWELRSCAYYSVFEQPKIMYQVIQYYAQYSCDMNGYLSNDKTFFLPNVDLYLLAVLNSPLMWWHNWRYLGHMKDEALNPAGAKMVDLPIAVPSDTLRNQVEPAVKQLINLSTELQTPEVEGERRHLEKQLSELVNQAYGLTPQELELLWRTAPQRMPDASPQNMEP
ncbi:Eco57I restriction-modification methylase domain-containing protein [Aggregatilinea lenta]|uniref:Eco57I restriction-modification methylase domain-containing protein n=1 Tax=Aggregatilinea lenta TaxID=913108 RepID=UPI000E5C03E1|nr:Eco57I restriction-modification methylase domain-containing protein [Aggregatilinea lenta]